MDVTSEEFIWWSTATESVSFLKNGHHFGHYKVVCSNSFIVTLHLKNISLSTNRGKSLLGWWQGVTVILEKSARNIQIEKLCTICFLEADFNWWLKIVFARSMTHQMKIGGIIPLRQDATEGKTTTKTSMTKQLFLDQATFLHEDCVWSIKHAKCFYDAVNHPARSISLQAVGVHIIHVRCYLDCVQQMQYYLHTEYGTAESTYGRATMLIWMGLSQGNKLCALRYLLYATLLSIVFEHTISWCPTGST